MLIRPAMIGDSALLLEWRNDPLTCAMSKDERPVPAEDHSRWFAAALISPVCKLLVVERCGDPVGTVRFDVGSAVEMSWTVAPNYRGRGVGKEMVTLALPRMPTKAYIKAGNIASQRIAEASGFRLIDSGEMQLWMAGEVQTAP